MTDVSFRFDVDSAPESVLRALKTSEGIRGFWTTQAEVPAEVGGLLRLGFDVAPAPFDLRLERSDERGVGWRTEIFPPHWIGTDIRWDVEPREGGATVSFCHAGFSDLEEAGRVAFTWGQIMVALKHYVETGTRNPVFV